MIKRSLEPANMELDDLMDNAQPHLNELKDHLNVLCRLLVENAGVESADEIKKIRIDICDTRIVVLSELIVLANDTVKELEYCLKAEAYAEFAAREVFDTVVRLILGMPVPNFNVNLSNPYRDFLYSEVKEEKMRLELCETELEGDLQRAEKILDQQPVLAANPVSLFNAGNKKTQETMKDELLDTMALK